MYIPYCLVLAVFWCVAFFSPPLSAQTSAFPPLDPDPWAREYSQRGVNGAYSWQDLAEIAFWASGARQDAGRNLIAAAVQDLAAQPDFPSSARERGEYVLKFMYNRYLRSYSAYQTRLDEVFSSGRYNCVSSAVLYTILAQAAGVEARGVLTKDHALVTVKIGSESIDVETTNPYGFDPGSRREFHDAFGKATGFVYVPARNYRDRVSISQLELVSLIFTNRISELESRGRFAEAVPLAADRAALLAGRRNPVSSPFFTDPQRDLLDRIYNYGASLLNAGKENDALAWGVTVAARYPGDTRWPEFIYACLNNRFIKLLQAGHIEEAQDTLNRYRGGLNREQAARLEGLLLEADLMKRIAHIEKPGDAEAALRIIDNAGPQALPAARAAEMRSYILMKEGQRRAGTEGARAAISFTEWGISRYGGNAQLDEALRVHRANRVAELHNRFADLFNRRDYEAARRVVQAGLEEFPGNRQFQSDMNLTEQALRGR